MSDVGQFLPMPFEETRIHPVHAKNDDSLTVCFGAMAGEGAGPGNQKRRYSQALARCHCFPPMYPKLRS